MRLHLIVIFDRSGSMAGPFTASGSPGAEDSVTEAAVKLDEARNVLIERLRVATFDFVTIIPFGDSADDPIAGPLPEDRLRIELGIRGIRAGGSTNSSSTVCWLKWS